MPQTNENAPRGAENAADAQSPAPKADAAESKNGGKYAEVQENDATNGNAQDFTEAIKAIESGNKAKMEKFARRYFTIAETSDLLKKNGVDGDVFTVRFGVLTKHYGKNDAHRIGLKDWENIIANINKPFAITRYGKGENSYRLWIPVLKDGNPIVVGVDVKLAGRDISVNSISTVFGFENMRIDKKDLVYPSSIENIDPQWRALLDGLNRRQYPSTTGNADSIAKNGEKVKGEAKQTEARKYLASIDFDKPIQTRDDAAKLLDAIGYTEKMKKGGIKNSLSRVYDSEERKGKKFVKFYTNGAVTSKVYLGETTSRDLMNTLLDYGNNWNLDLPEDVVNEYNRQRESFRKFQSEYVDQDIANIKKLLANNGVKFADVVESERGYRIAVTDNKTENGNYTDYVEVRDIEDAKERLDEIRSKANEKQKETQEEAKLQTAKQTQPETAPTAEKQNTTQNPQTDSAAEQTTEVLTKDYERYLKKWQKKDTPNEREAYERQYKKPAAKKLTDKEMEKRQKQIERMKQTTREIAAKKRRQMEQYLAEFGSPNSILAYGLENGSILNRPPMRRVKTKNGWRNEFYGDPSGADEALNNFFDSMDAKNRAIWDKRIFGGKKQTKTEGKIGNDGRLEDFIAFERGYTDITNDDSSNHPYQGNFDQMLADYAEQWEAFDEWVKNGAKSRDEMIDEANRVEFEDGETYYMDDINASEEAREDFYAALGFVEKYKANSWEVRELSPESLADTKVGDIVRFDHDDSAMRFVDYDAKSEVLTVHDFNKNFILYEVTKYDIKEINVIPIQTEENTDGQQDKKVADDDDARDAQGGRTADADNGGTARTERAETAEGNAENLTLDGGTVESNKADAERVAKQKKDKQAKEDIATKQTAPMAGGVGDLNQMGLFGGAVEDNLFNQPPQEVSPVAKPQTQAQTQAPTQATQTTQAIAQPTAQPKVEITDKEAYRDWRMGLHGNADIVDTAEAREMFNRQMADRARFEGAPTSEYEAWLTAMGKKDSETTRKRYKKAPVSDLITVQAKERQDLRNRQQNTATAQTQQSQPSQNSQQSPAPKAVSGKDAVAAQRTLGGAFAVMDDTSLKAKVREWQTHNVNPKMVEAANTLLAYREQMCNAAPTTQGDETQGGPYRGDTRFSIAPANPTERADYEKRIADIIANAPRNAQGRLLAPNGKPSNLTERQYAQVRTKEFKFAHFVDGHFSPSFFGAWDLRNKVFNIVAGDTAPFNNTAGALAWAKENGIVGTMNDTETNGKGEIRISAESIREMLNLRQREKSASPESHYAALMQLRNIIRESEVTDVHQDFKKGKDGKRDPENGVNENVLIEVLHGAFNFNGQIYRVKTTLKQYKPQYNTVTKAYAYEVSEIEVMDGTLPSGKNTTAATAITSITGDILLNGVRNVNGELTLDDHSKVLDENGEPRVVYHGSRNFGFSKFRSIGENLVVGQFFSSSINVASSYSNVERVNNITEFDKEENTGRPDNIDDSIKYLNDLNKAGEHSWEYRIVDKNNFIELMRSHGNDEYIIEDVLNREESAEALSQKQFVARFRKRETHYHFIAPLTISRTIKEAQEYFDLADYGARENKFAREMGRLDVGGNYATFLNMRNPRIIDANGRPWNNIRIDGTRKETDQLANESLTAGFDGMIIINVMDNGEFTNHKKDWINNYTADDYITFSNNQIKSATDNTGAFDAANPDIRFSILGEKGAARLDDAEKVIANLKVAKDALGSRKWDELDKDEKKKIRLATGWEMGADGKWRYEVPDGKFDIDWLRSENFNYLADIFDMPELYKIYPWLNDTQVRIDERDLSGGRLGAYSPSYNMIVLSTGIKEFLQDKKLFDRKEYLDYRNERKRLIDEENSLVEKLREKNIVTPDEIDEGWENNKDIYNRICEFIVAREKLDKKFRESELGKKFNELYISEDLIDAKKSAIEKRTRSVLIHEIQHAIQHEEGFAKGGNPAVDGFEDYLKQAGEVESRNAEKRINMTAEERRNTLLEETEDVARENQIYWEERDGAYAKLAEAMSQPSQSSDIRFSVTPADRTEWNAKLDEYANGTIDRTKPIKVLSVTPPKMQRVLRDFHGVNINKPIEISAGVIDKVTMGKHGVTVDSLRSLQDNLDEPIAIFKSATRNDSIVVLTEIVDEKNGNNAIVAVNYNATELGGMKINAIMSIYGKDNQKIYQDWINNGLLEYVSKEKNNRLPYSQRLYLPRGGAAASRLLTEKDFQPTNGNIISNPGGNVNGGVRFSTASTEDAANNPFNAEVKQIITSAGTSLAQNDPTLYKSTWFDKELKPGAKNFDIGAGRTIKPTKRMADKGVTNIPFDPFNRDKATNRAAINSVVNGERYPTVTCANVLNVIAEPESRRNVILQAAKALSPDGKAFFDVYTAPKEGVTKTGTYQTAMKPEQYMPEIESVFGKVERHGSIIIASQPKAEALQGKASWWDANPFDGGETIRFSVRISKEEYAKLASEVSKNDAESYRKGIEPPPVNYAHTYDWGYVYDRFEDGTFAVKKRYNLNSKNSKIFFNLEKEYKNAIDTARIKRPSEGSDLHGDPVRIWGTRRTDYAVGIADNGTAVGDGTMDAARSRQNGKMAGLRVGDKRLLHNPRSLSDAGVTEPVTRFSTATRTATADDPNVFFTAFESLRARGIDPNTLFNSVSDRERNAQARADLRDPNYIQDIIAKALNNTALDAQESNALRIYVTDTFMRLDDVRKRIIATGDRSLEAEEQLLEKVFARAVSARSTAASNAGASLREQQVGAALDSMRDDIVYLRSEVQARKAKQGLPTELTADEEKMIQRQAEELRKANERIAELMAENARIRTEEKKKWERNAIEEERRRAKASAENMMKRYDVSDRATMTAVIAIADDFFPRSAQGKALFLSSGGPNSERGLNDSMRNMFAGSIASLNNSMNEARRFWAENYAPEAVRLFDEYVAELNADTEGMSISERVAEREKKVVERAKKVKSRTMPTGGWLAKARKQVEGIIADNEIDAPVMRIALGEYLRKFARNEMRNNPGITDAELHQRMAEEANKLDPSGKYTDDNMIDVMLGTNGFDFFTKETGVSRLYRLREAQKLAEQGMTTEARKRLASTSRQNRAYLTATRTRSVARLNRARANWRTFSPTRIPTRRSRRAALRI